MNREDLELLVGIGTDPEAGPRPGVWAMLNRYKDTYRRGKLVDEGAPKGRPGNIIKVLTHDDRWAGQLRLNEFTQDHERNGEALGETDDTRIGVWMEEHYGMEAKTSAVREAVAVVTENERHHPVRDYLSGLQWDGEKRIHRLLSRYIGAEDTPLNSEVSTRWCISAVARILVPGTKVDTTLVLVGPQGALKSTAFQTLATRDEWFADSALDLRSKDAYQALPGVWIYELSELDSVNRREASSVKAFLSSRADRYRPSFAKRTITVRRQCVFVGTTNEQEFLNDPTGARRFWPVRVGDIDLPAIRRDRDQIWSEAVHRFRSKERHWLDAISSKLLVEAQDEFRRVDPWEHPIKEFLARPTNRNGVTVAQILTSACELKVDKQGKNHSMRVAGILTGLGCTKKRKRQGANRPVLWYPEGVRP